MHKFFEQLSSDSAWDWNGFTGEIPEDDIMKAALTKDHSLYLFCGHGGGECILPRPKFERIFLDGARDENFLQCQSAMVLMGCRSGRLISINSPEDEYAPIGEFHYEPDGAIISYLCAGAPCVVANLWDVTDHDIDR
jgi:separase